MRHSWRLLTLLGGVGLVVVAFTMIAATTLESPPAIENGHSGDGSHGVVREYRDRQLSVRFYYPTTWQPQENVEGVTLQPDTASADFIEQGAFFAILRGDDEDAPPLPPTLQQVIKSENAVRASENVAVGGMSGTETVVELDVATADTVPANAQLASALRAAESQRLTVIVWKSERDDSPIWVIMADARAGEYLGTLQEIRNSIQWE
jgi:hypothetical protein